MTEFVPSLGINLYRMRSSQHAVTSYSCLVTELVHSCDLLGKGINGYGHQTQIRLHCAPSRRDFVWGVVDITFGLNVDPYYLPS